MRRRHANFGLSCPLLMLVAFVIGVAICAKLYTGSTEYGDCVGLLDERDPAYVYEAPVGNLIVGFVLVETIVVPGVILLKELWCPIAPVGSP